MTLLQCDEHGLTDEEAARRIGIFGPNKVCLFPLPYRPLVCYAMIADNVCLFTSNHHQLEEKKENAFLQFLSFMWNPLSWVMEGAALVAIALSNGQGQPPDWQDFVGIILLLFINSTIGFVEERNAGNAVKALMESLAPKARVKRGGAWREIEVSFRHLFGQVPLSLQALLTIFSSLPRTSLLSLFLEI